jgi:hypothetical protein
MMKKIDERRQTNIIGLEAKYLSEMIITLGV